MRVQRLNPLDFPPGERFGRLLLLATMPGGRNGLRAECRCDCGKITVTQAARLRNGVTRSCGCLLLDYVRSDAHKTHGKCYSRTYRKWAGMLQRCNPRSVSAGPYHAGKGIKVCERWHKFENFLADMGEAPPGLTLDRIDNSKDYEPSNCRWATPQEQARNRDYCHVVTHNGVTKRLTDWADEMGTKSRILLQRMERGWSVAKTLDTPISAPGTLKTR